MGGSAMGAAALVALAVLCCPPTQPLLQAGSRAAGAPPARGRRPVLLPALVLRGGAGALAGAGAGAGTGAGGAAAPAWDPQCLGVVTSRAIQQLAARARVAPTGEDVFEMAKRVHPHDKALALGAQNMSIYGHAHTVRRLHAFKHYSER
jgi:hypothetical protein